MGRKVDVVKYSNSSFLLAVSADKMATNKQRQMQISAYNVFADLATQQWYSASKLALESRQDLSKLHIKIGVDRSSGGPPTAESVVQEDLVAPQAKRAPTALRGLPALHFWEQTCSGLRGFGGDKNNQAGHCKASVVTEIVSRGRYILAHFWGSQ